METIDQFKAFAMGMSQNELTKQAIKHLFEMADEDLSGVFREGSKVFESFLTMDQKTGQAALNSFIHGLITALFIMSPVGQAAMATVENIGSWLVESDLGLAHREVRIGKWLQ